MYGIQKKLEAIRRVANGESAASVARSMGVSGAIVRKWCRDEEKIRYQSSSSDIDGSWEASSHKRYKLDDSSMQPLNLSWRPNLRKAARPSYDRKSYDFFSSQGSAGSNLQLTQRNSIATRPTADQHKNGDLPLEEQDRTEAIRQWVEHQQLQQEMWNAAAATISSQVALSNDSRYAPTRGFQGMDENAGLLNWYRVAYQANPRVLQLAHPPPMLVQQKNQKQKDGNDRRNAENLMAGGGKTAATEGVTPNGKTVTGTANSDVNWEEFVSQGEEAVERGEKFLRWLRNLSDPLVTVVEVNQFISLLNNMKLSIKRKRFELEHKTKVKK